MSRNNPPGTIQKTVDQAYAKAGGLHSASDFIGLCVATLSEHTQMPKGGKRAGGLGINYADTLAQKSPEAAAVFAAHFAAHAGGVFQPLELGDAGNLYDLCGEVAKECGEAQSATIRAANSADKRDIQKAQRELDEAIISLTRAKAALLSQGAKMVPVLGAVS